MILPAGRVACHDGFVTRPFDVHLLLSLLGTATLGRSVFYRPSTPSTMDDAREQAEADAPEGSIALADEQTAGRGRFGRTWVSPANVNIYATLILRPETHVLRSLAIIAPLAVCHGIEDVAGLPTAIKWPNDVLLGDPPRKVAGVLIDSELVADDVRFALVGMGINVNLETARYPEISDIAVSVSEAAGREISREHLLASILGHLEALYRAAQRGEPVHCGWRQRLHTLGQSVRVNAAGRADEGVAVDALDDGRLLLRRDDGSTVALDAGEVTLRG